MVILIPDTSAPRQQLASVKAIGSVNMDPDMNLSSCC